MTLTKNDIEEAAQLRPKKSTSSTMPQKASCGTNLDQWY